MPDYAPIAGPIKTLASNDLLQIMFLKTIKRCPGCGAKIKTNVCVACVIEAKKKAERLSHGIKDQAGTSSTDAQR